MTSPLMSMCRPPGPSYRLPRSRLRRRALANGASWSASRAVSPTSRTQLAMIDVRLPGGPARRMWLYSASGATSGFTTDLTAVVVGPALINIPIEVSSVGVGGPPQALTVLGGGGLSSQIVVMDLGPAAKKGGGSLRNRRPSPRQARPRPAKPCLAPCLLDQRSSEASVTRSLSDGKELSSNRPPRLCATASSSCPMKQSDRYGDTISASGWELESFKRNPIALFGHNHDFPIGRWTDVHVEGARRCAASSSSRPRDVGPHRRNRQPGRRRHLQRRLSRLSPDQDARAVQGQDGHETYGVQFVGQELLETSLVPIPANPNALAIAKCAEHFPRHDPSGFRRVRRSAPDASASGLHRRVRRPSTSQHKDARLCPPPLTNVSKPDRP